MIIDYLGQTSYDQMLTSEYDKKFKEKMESVDFHRFQDPIFLFKGMIQPENLEWEYNIFNIGFGSIRSKSMNS